MKTKAVIKSNTEKIMDKLCIYFEEATLELIISVEEEIYEYAAEIRDDMELKMERVADMLIRYKCTLLEKEDVIAQLNEVKFGYFKKWYDQLHIPGDKQIYNI